MIIIGDEESQNNTVSIRARDGNQKNGIPVEEFITNLASENSSRKKKLELI